MPRRSEDKEGSENGAKEELHPDDGLDEYDGAEVDEAERSPKARDEHKHHSIATPSNEEVEDDDHEQQEPRSSRDKRHSRDDGSDQERRNSKSEKKSKKSKKRNQDEHDSEEETRKEKSGRGVRSHVLEKVTPKFSNIVKSKTQDLEEDYVQLYGFIYKNIIRNPTDRNKKPREGVDAHGLADHILNGTLSNPRIVQQNEDTAYKWSQVRHDGNALIPVGPVYLLGMGLGAGQGNDLHKTYTYMCVNLEAGKAILAAIREKLDQAKYELRANTCRPYEAWTHTLHIPRVEAWSNGLIKKLDGPGDEQIAVEVMQFKCMIKGDSEDGLTVSREKNFSLAGMLENNPGIVANIAVTIGFSALVPPTYIVKSEPTGSTKSSKTRGGYAISERNEEVIRQSVTDVNSRTTEVGAKIKIHLGVLRKVSMAFAKATGKNVPLGEEETNGRESEDELDRIIRGSNFRRGGRY